MLSHHTLFGKEPSGPFRTNGCRIPSEYSTAYRRRLRVTTQVVVAAQAAALPAPAGSRRGGSPSPAGAPNGGPLARPRSAPAPRHTFWRSWVLQTPWRGMETVVGEPGRESLIGPSLHKMCSSCRLKAGVLPISANLPLFPRSLCLLHAVFCRPSGCAPARCSSQIRTADS